MAEFDDTLNALLSNPESMSQIMNLAQSLSGGASTTPPPPSPAPPPPATANGGLGALASGLDPQLLMRLLPLVQELGSESNTQSRQLLYALRPYLRTERQEKVDRALRLARMIHLGKTFLADWGDGGV